MVSGLLARAEQVAASDWPRVTHHGEYGFPDFFSYNDPQAVDEEWSWRVVSFEVEP